MSGWKTYLFWLLAAVVTILFSQEIIGETAYKFLIGIFVPAGAISQRMATKNLERKVDVAAAASVEASVSAEAAKKAVMSE